jgi:5-aminolevulinate synthase
VGKPRRLHWRWGAYVKEPEPLWTDQQLGVDKVVQEMKAAGPVGVMEALLEREREETARAVASAS